MISVTTKSVYKTKIKGRQRLGTDRLRISQRIKILFCALMARMTRSISAFNGAFGNRVHLKNGLQKNQAKMMT